MLFDYEKISELIDAIIETTKEVDIASHIGVESKPKVSEKCYRLNKGRQIYICRPLFCSAIY